MIITYSRFVVDEISDKGQYLSDIKHFVLIRTKENSDVNSEIMIDL